jgi:hypothetical protein
MGPTGTDVAPARAVPVKLKPKLPAPVTCTCWTRTVETPGGTVPVKTALPAVVAVPVGVAVIVKVTGVGLGLVMASSTVTNPLTGTNAGDTLAVAVRALGACQWGVGSTA